MRHTFTCTACCPAPLPFPQLSYSPLFSLFRFTGVLPPSYSALVHLRSLTLKTLTHLTRSGLPPPWSTLSQLTLLDVSNSNAEVSHADWVYQPPGAHCD